jgi:NhaP-type Na+/H+ or K+/H+ antiporter
MLGYGIGLMVSLFCKLGLKRHIQINKTHAEHLSGSSEATEKQSQYSQGNSEIGMLILFPWISYLLAEAMNLTSMITVFSCGVAIGQFGLKNLRTPDRVVSAFEAACREDICHNIRYLPVNILHLHRHRLHRLRHRHLVDCFYSRAESYSAIFICFGLVLVTRAISVFVAGLANDLFFPGLLSNKQKVLIWISGLRGAVGNQYLRPAFAFSLKCLRHLNDKEAAHKIFSLVIFISGMSVVPHDLDRLQVPPHEVALFLSINPTRGRNL